MEPVPFINLEPWVQKVRSVFDAPLNAVVRPGGKLYEAGHSFIDDVDHLLDSLDFLGGGVTTQKLEAKLAANLGAQHVVTCANGTDALQLALRACGIDRGSRVAIPNLTFFATYEAVVNVGATPILLDIDPVDYQLSFEEFERAHNARRFDAAILVHLYGWTSRRLADFRTFCRERRITLIEDGAQAFGVTPGGAHVFADADVATLSFHPAKVLGGIGDGGAVVTKNARIAARVRSLANHGRAPGRDQHEHVAVGWNSRLDAIQAAWLLRALDVIDEVIDARQQLWVRYWGTLCDGDLLSPLPWADSNGYMTVLRGQTPGDEIVKKLNARGIGARCIYPRTLADQDVGGALTFGPLMNSRVAAHHVVSLPLWYGMDLKTVDRCAKAFMEVAR